jgi:hypothetical protein
VPQRERHAKRVWLIKPGSISLTHREIPHESRFQQCGTTLNESVKGQDILALGFMTFALFVGAGNIIFPPIVGLQSGPHVWMAALGFLITAVGLPVITVVAWPRSVAAWMP